jgi:hypothetical protein
VATNPRIPEPDNHARVHEEDTKKRHFPVPLIIIIVAAAILAALAWYLPRTPVANPQPSGAVSPVQPTAGQIQLTNVSLASSPVGNHVYIDAILHNTGNTSITGVLANVSFPGSNGATAGTIQAPVTALTGGNNAVSESLLDHPIAPGAQQSVRIDVIDAPQGWNHQLPGISIATVTGASAEGGPPKPPQQSGAPVTTDAPRAPATPAQPQQ